MIFIAGKPAYKTIMMRPTMPIAFFSNNRGKNRVGCIGQRIADDRDEIAGDKFRRLERDAVLDAAGDALNRQNCQKHRNIDAEDR